MCRTDEEPGGPRRCPGDARAAYGRAASTVAMLEAEEASVLADLDEPENSHRVEGNSAPQAYLSCCPQTAGKLSRRRIVEIIASVGLNLRDWDIDAITKSANASIEDKLYDLGPEDDWTKEDVAAAYAEHGEYAAVDFLELVAENPAHDAAPNLFENGFGLRYLGTLRHLAACVAGSLTADEMTPAMSC